MAYVEVSFIWLRERLKDKRKLISVGGWAGGLPTGVFCVKIGHNAPLGSFQTLTSLCIKSSLWLAFFRLSSDT